LQPPFKRRSRTRTLLRGLLILTALLCPGGCHSEGGTPAPLVVLAAASLSDSFRAIGQAYEAAHPGARVFFSFAGSQTLATHLREGVEADVIATADPEIMDDLAAVGLVDTPEVFATNRLVWIVRQNLSERSSPTDLAELMRARLRIAIAAAEVPAGRYARESLLRLGLLDQVEAQIVSQELDVKGVVTKVRIAGADAGAVYATDVRPEWGDEIAVLEVPDPGRVRPSYAIAVVSRSARPGEASGFREFVRSHEVRQMLLEHGFGMP
jgi:molybdate transport system substrate-binding protein